MLQLTQIVIVLILAMAISYASAISMYSLNERPAAKPDWIDDIIELLEDIVGTTKKARDTSDPFTLDEYLDSCDAWCEQILNPLRYPHLTPIDAGQPGSALTFSTLAEAADQCVAWAQDARKEMDELEPDHAAIGYALDSIKLAIPQWRELAGID